MSVKTACGRVVCQQEKKVSVFKVKVYVKSFQKQLSDIAKRIEELFKDKHGECEIPDDLIKEIARCLVPDIITFFETEEAKSEFEEWKAEQEKKIASKTKNEAMPK